MQHLKPIFILLLTILTCGEINGQKKAVKSRYLEQLMRLDFKGSLRHAEDLDADYSYPYFSTITQFLRNAGQFPGEDSVQYLRLPPLEEGEPDTNQLIGLVRASFLLYNDPSNQETFNTLSHVILMARSDGRTELLKLAYLLMMELYGQEVVQTSENYVKFLKQYEELAETSHELAWYHIHYINYITKMLHYDKAESLYHDAIDEIIIHFEKHNLTQQLMTHYHFLMGVYHRHMVFDIDLEKVKVKQKENFADTLKFNDDQVRAFRAARSSYKKAIELSGEHAFLRYNKFSSYIHLVVVEASLNNYDEAWKSLSLAREYQNRSDISRSAYILDLHSAIWYYDKIGAYDSAFKALERAAYAENRLDFRKNSLRISEMNVELESAEKENQILKKENQLQKATRWLWVIISLSILLVALLLLLLKASKNIQTKNKRIELLMKELHHRVKNNLQVISSLLGLQSMKLKDQNARDAINEGKDRLRAMALIHQKLYTNQGEGISNLNIREYLTDLIEELARSYSNGVEVDLRLNIADIEMNTDTALPLGLIMNEMVSNAFKHAFKEIETPLLEITLTSGAGEISVRITDNGLGMSNDFDPQKASSFGMRLIQLLTKQLSGKLEYDGTRGVCYQLILPLKN